MDFKRIVIEIEKGKKIKDVLSESNFTLEELLLKVLKDNYELRERIDKSEQYISNVLIDMRTPW